MEISTDSQGIVFGTFQGRTALLCARHATRPVYRTTDLYLNPPPPYDNEHLHSGWPWRGAEWGAGATGCVMFCVNPQPEAGAA